MFNLIWAYGLNISKAMRHLRKDAVAFTPAKRRFFPRHQRETSDNREARHQIITQNKTLNEVLYRQAYQNT